MGICWSFQAASSTPGTTGHLSTGITGTSQATTTNTTSSSSGSSNVSQASTSHSSISSGSEFNPSGHILPLPNIRCFSFAELKVATRNFRADMVLGEGGFGKVFRGYLDEKTPTKSGTVVAVKKLNSESWQGFEEWQSEVNFLGRLSHPNLVKLLGYCLEDQELLLVYEFMPKGSLENHLFGKGSSVQPLPWDIRLKIAIGAARGLAFLHMSERQVIYRDFKASNILLDGAYTAKISDFGLAKLGPTASKSHITTRVIGTHGYAAPEYVATGHLYVKSDVYGFGVVLVELLTGLRALDTSRPAEHQNLVTWVQPLLSKKRELRKIMDSRFEGKYTLKSAYQIAQLALKCIETKPNDRPSMKEVLESLEALERAESSKVKLSRTKTRTRTHSSHSMPRRNVQQPLHPLNPLHRSQTGSRSPLRMRSPLHPSQSVKQTYKNSPRLR